MKRIPCLLIVLLCLIFASLLSILLFVRSESTVETTELSVKSTSKNRHATINSDEDLATSKGGIFNQRLQLASISSGLRIKEVPLVVSKRFRGQTKFTELPEKYTREVEPHKPANKFILRPSFVEKENITYFILFFVKSTCRAQDRRKSIRETWGAITDINGRRFGVVFLIGVCPDNTSQLTLQTESEKHGDILQSDVPDQYKDLPAKVLSGYQWIYYHETLHSDFYAWTDDDCVVNIAIIYDYFSSNFEQFQKNPAVHCGFRYNEFEIPTRGNSKYGVLESTYPGKLFPAFCHGGLSVMPIEYLRDIYRQAEITERDGLHLEDVYITGILRFRTGKGNSNIQRMFLESKNRGISKYLGPFVWHVGSVPSTKETFASPWRVVFNLMTVQTNGTLTKGYWPSSRYLVAQANPGIVFPQSQGVEAFFQANFGTYVR